jgi:TIR domain/YEATS family
MSLGIRQDATYAGDGFWRWSVWLDGPDAELDGVESVEWVLHPTFPNPLVLVKQRQTRFRLDASGWGAFEINAHVLTRDGRKQHLKHWLRLERPDGAPAGPKAAAPSSVFVSAGVKDAAWEEAVRDALARRGLVVLTASDIPGGVPFDAAINSTLDKADLVVGIFSEKSGPWAEREVSKAMEKDLSVVPLVVGPHARIPPSLEKGVQAVRVERLAQVDAAVGRIVDQLM